ncbi:MAG: hypothetical protein H0W62_01790 [Chitinophagales bacterium]|nr:hypothetical protein [Chitinophagales bacterium]
MKTIYIPGNSGWRSTDPNDVKQKLTDANTKYNNVVRPIIRLLKAWNCNVSYPFDSYLMELKLTGMNFYNDTVQTGFFYAVMQLNADLGDPQFKKDKIESLKYNTNEVKKALDGDDMDRAKKWLHRVLPEA